jgi:hypothetical protein
MSERLTGDFRKFMDKSFLGAWDVPETGDLILTIDHVSVDEVQNQQGKEKKMTLHFKERGYKPMVCNITNATMIGEVYHSNKVEDWEGKKIALYVAQVNGFGKLTDALRVRPYPPKADILVCEDCGADIEDVTVDGKTYRAKSIANNALTKVGRYLCYDCYIKAKEQEAELA